MADDPISLLMVLLLAETGPAVVDGVAIVDLDGGVRVEHNPTTHVVVHRGIRIHPQATLVRRFDVPVGIITPWRWHIASDEDVVRSALLRALGHQRDGFPPLRLSA